MPSTYADILSKLSDRKYILLKQKRYEPSDIVRVVCNFLKKNFWEFVNDEFTSQMESD